MKLSRVKTDNIPTILVGANKNEVKLNLQFFAEDGKDKEDEEEKEDEENEEDEGEEKTFTQEEVNKMMAREKRQGKASVYKQYGYKSEKEFSLAMEKLKTPPKKLEEEKKDEKVDNTKELELEERATKAEIKVEALALGAKKEFLDDLIILALKRMDDGSTAEEVIGDMKEKYTSMFKSDKEDDEEEKGKGGKKTTGKSPKSKQNAQEQKGLGARLAALRGGQPAKSSFFGN